MKDLNTVNLEELEEMEEIICPGEGTIFCC